MIDDERFINQDFELLEHAVRAIDAQNLLNRMHDNESWLTSSAAGMVSQLTISSANQPHHPNPQNKLQVLNGQ